MARDGDRQGGQGEENGLPFESQEVDVLQAGASLAGSRVPPADPTHGSFDNNVLIIMALTGWRPHSAREGVVVVLV